MEALPLNLVRPEVPVELAVIVATMMAKEPERRFQTPREVAQALAPFFKKEIPASRGTLPETSLAEAASRQEPSRATAPVATQTAAIGPGSSAPAARSAAPAPAGSGWDTLIEFKQEADLSEEVRALREARRSPAWLWPAAACVPVLLGLAVFLGMKIEAGKNRKNVEPATPIASRTKAEQPDPAEIDRAAPGAGGASIASGDQAEAGSRANPVQDRDDHRPGRQRERCRPTRPGSPGRE